MPRKPLLRWLALALVIVGLFFWRPILSGKLLPSSSILLSSTSHGPLDDVSWVRKVLKEKHIGPQISLASRTIRYRLGAPSRPPLTDVDHELFPREFQFQDTTVDQKLSMLADTSLELLIHPSERPDQVDASNLIFGVSTTLERFDNPVTSPIKEWVRWLTDGSGHTNGAGLVLALFNSTQPEIDKAYDRLISVGINATVLPSDISLDMAGRYVSLVNMLYNHPTRDQREYFALIDDDTFFPAISALANKLSEYSPKKPYYIGTFTERVDWFIGNKAPMAYGGGGVFMTAPVAKKVLEVDCLEKNSGGGYVVGGDQGDHLLYNCLKNRTEITLTYLPLLHQEDQFGDPSGFYESGQQPLSLHHYKSWHHLKPEKMHVVASACGVDCVLQRFRFKDDFILTNGYSVAQYPRGIDFDLALIEGTMDDGLPIEEDVIKDVVFSYSFGMLRKSLNGTGRKRSWLLLDSREVWNGKVQQIYVKRRDDQRWIGPGEQPPERDSVVLLTWVP